MFMCLGLHFGGLGESNFMFSFYVFADSEDGPGGKEPTA